MRHIWIIIIMLVLTLIGCSSKPNSAQDPREVVINMFGAMQENDRKALAHYIDFERMVRPRDTDYALSGDTARNFVFPDNILDDLTDGGLTKKRWFSMQRIVNTAEDMGDSALVEVSFISKDNTQYLTKFGLRKINDVWKIYSFNVRDNE